MKKSMKRLLSLVLSLAMVVSLLPSMAAEAAVVDASKTNVWAEGCARGAAGGISDAHDGHWFYSGGSGLTPVPR